MMEREREPPPSAAVDETDRSPSWPPFPMMVEEDCGNTLSPRVRRVPDCPELLALTRIAIALGNPRAV